MYLIINKDYTLQQVSILTGNLRSQCKRGKISIVNTKTMQGLNTNHYQEDFGEEWSEIPRYG